MSKHGEELGKMNAELIKALQANRDKRRAEREERESIDSQLVNTLVSTSYYSECECGQTLEGEGEYDPADGTLYGNDCESCGEEFTVLGWYEYCDYCEVHHGEGECESDE